MVSRAPTLRVSVPHAEKAAYSGVIHGLALVATTPSTRSLRSANVTPPGGVSVIEAETVSDEWLCVSPEGLCLTVSKVFLELELRLYCCLGWRC